MSFVKLCFQFACTMWFRLAEIVWPPPWTFSVDSHPELPGHNPPGFFHM